MITRLQACFDRRHAPVVVVTASHEEINEAAEAMRAGAFDCLFRPFSPSRLAKTIAAALEAKTRGKSARMRDPEIETGLHARSLRSNAPARERVIAASPQMRDLVARAATLAATEIPIVILGEVGTGKTLFAEAVHEASPRHDGPLTTLHGPTLTAEKLEDIAATVSAAGTLLIEEICEIETGLQARLLSHVEGWETGGLGPRLVATSRHDPVEAIRAGRLRPGLYYRLNVGSLKLPPLAGRGADIALIARSVLADYVRAEGRAITGFSEAALEALMAYDWPGNVRELLNVLRLTALTQNGPVITPAALPAELLEKRRTPSADPARPFAGSDLVGRSLAEIERLVIEAMIEAEGGSLPRAARVLGIAPSTLYRKREAWAARDD